MEITPQVADGAGSVIVEQVANGVTVRMAVLYLLLSGESDGTASTAADAASDAAGGLA